jgi:hypothetical protein
MTHENGETVRPNRERGPSIVLGCQEIPAVSGGSSVHSNNGPQTFTIHYGPRQSRTSYSGSKVTALVSLLGRIFVSD